jgi:hypothetical protein
MNDDPGYGKHDRVLAGLVMSLQMVKNPLTDRIERDLEQARGAIDVLQMLQAKCRQDTAREILDLLDRAVMELQMNYLEELHKDQAPPSAEEQSGAAGGSAGDPAGPEETTGSEKDE